MRTEVLGRSSRKRGRQNKQGARFLPGSAIQVFVLKVDAFLGTELFGGEIPVNVGRHRECSIRLDDETVSRVHCRLELVGEVLYIEDLGSANGTLVNSQRINTRTAVQATDAVQIGDFTLKVRALIPRSIRQARPTSGMSDKTTRRNAVLSADGFIDTDESHIDLGRDVDPRLYEAALRRVTGGDRAVSPVPLVVMEGGRNRDQEAQVERERTARDNSVIEQLKEEAEPPTHKGFDLEPGFDQRINELENAVRRLTHSANNVKTERRAPASKQVKRKIVKATGSKAKNNARPTAAIRKVRPITDKPVQKPQKPGVFKAWVDLVQESSVDELARAMGTSAAFQSTETPWKKDQKATRSYKKQPARKKSELGPSSVSLPKVRARRASRLDSLNIPAALSVPTGMVATEQVRPRAPAKGKMPHEFGRAAPQRHISELAVTPRAQLSEESSDTELELQDVLGHRPVLMRLPSENIVPRAFTPKSKPSAPRTKPARRRLPARLVTPTGMQICVSPLSRKGSSQGFRPVSDRDILNGKAIQEDLRESNQSQGFYAIEITTRQRGRLVDVARLCNNGEQYILGYPTPQGAKAPSCGHVGLRMIKINADRTVDLVFPRYASGHLIRDGEVVRFSELSQGRKYSSVRLIPSDEVTLILTSKGKQVTYCVRFLENNHQ